MAKIQQPPLADDELARQATGNPVAFQALYTRFAKRVFGLLATLKLEPHAADDVAQQVWTKVWTSLANKPSDSPFVPWLMRLARNTAIDHLRRKTVAALPEDDILPAQGQDDVAAEVDESHEMERLRHCIALLPDPERRVLQGRLEGHDSPAIASTLGLPSERVHRLFHEAKHKVQRCLGVAE